MMLNPRQERFCQLYHETGNASQSYETAYGCASLIACQNSWRLLRNDGVKERLAELQGESRAHCSMSRAEIIDYLIEAIVTPVSDVTAESRLCEEKTVVFRRGRDEGDGAEEVEKIKMISKGTAIKELNRMLGNYAPEEIKVGADDALTKLLGQIRDKR